jgi:hypothetical protein
MLMLEAVLNQPLTTTVYSSTGAAPSGYQLFLNGALSTDVPSVTLISGNAWSVTFTPTSTGIYSFQCFGAISFRVRAVQKSLYTSLTNLEDEAFGSWQWDKTTGALTLLRQNGTSLATFTVQDTMTSGSRERTA